MHYAFMAMSRFIGGLDAGLSVEQVQSLHSRSVPSIGFRVQFIGVSGAGGSFRVAVGKSGPQSVDRVQTLSVKQVRGVRCIECKRSVERMQGDSMNACGAYGLRTWRAA